MASRDELYTALRNADAAGDNDGAAKLAAYIKTMPADAPPVIPAAATPPPAAPPAAPPDSTLKQIAMAPVGAAEQFLKAGTGVLSALPAGLAYGGAAVGKALGADVDPDAVQKTVSDALTYKPVSNSGQAAGKALSDTYSPLSKAVASKADEAATAVGKVSPTAETFLRAAPGAAQAAAGVLPVVGAVGEGISAARTAAVPTVARNSADVAKEAGYTGVNTRADLNSPGNKKVTDVLIGKDAGIPDGTPPSTAALTEAARRGPARVYDQAQNDLPPTLTQSPKLRDALASLQDSTSQMPKSPEVADLQKALLNQPEMTKEQLFNNVREARQRASAYLASDDPDKNALGDAYRGVANAYEDFIGDQLKANPEATVTLEKFQQARTQFAKNYMAQAALKGDHFDPLVYGRTAQRNPNLLSGHAAIVGQVANSTEAATGGVGRSVAPVAAGALAGEAAGHFAGVPGVGAAVGAVAAPLVKDAVHNFMTRGDVGKAAGAADNPALSYFFNNGELPEGWNRSQPEQKPMLALPAPSMVNAGGGATTPTGLNNLGLTPDVQAAAAAHPGAPRPGVPLPPPPRPPMQELGNPQTEPSLGGAPAPPKAAPKTYQDRLAAQVAALRGGAPAYEPPNWGLQSNGTPPTNTPNPGGIPLANVLAHGVEQPPAPGLSLAPHAPVTADVLPFQRNAAHEAGDLKLAPEDAWFKPGARTTGSQYADVLSGKVPNKFRDRGAPTTNNASGESAASVEAINRGSLPLMLVNPDGIGEKVLPGVSQADVNPSKGHILIDESTGEVVKRGPDLNKAAGDGLRNRWASQAAAEQQRLRFQAQALRN